MANVYEIKDDFFWVGALDPNLRVFDIVMETEFGTTYNAYLLKGSEKTVLFETVKDKFFDDFLARLTSFCSVQDLDYIVVNHTEPDHSGSVARLLDLNPNITVVGSSMAIKYMRQLVNAPFQSLIVKDSQTLCLGNKTIQFISVPLLHWPDSMYSYVVEDKLLITCDSFGAHYSDDCVLKSKLSPKKHTDYLSAYKYYFDMIFGPFKSYMLKALDKIEGLEIDFICPGHGLVLDHGVIDELKTLYEQWATPSVRDIPSVVIPYTSAYGYTESLARAIAKGVSDARPDMDVLVMDMVTTPFDQVLSEASLATGLLIGSPTIVSDTVPPIWQLLTSLNPIVHQGIIAGCFGSYGWSGEATKYIQERFKQLRFKTPLDPFKVLFKPSEDDLKDAYHFGKHFSEYLK